MSEVWQKNIQWDGSILNAKDESDAKECLQLKTKIANFTIQNRRQVFSIRWFAVSILVFAFYDHSSFCQSSVFPITFVLILSDC